MLLGSVRRFESLHGDCLFFINFGKEKILFSKVRTKMSGPSDKKWICVYFPKDPELVNKDLTCDFHLFY